MKLPFCPSIDILSADIQVVVKCHIAAKSHFPKLVIDDVLDKTGKVSLLFNEDQLWVDLGYRLADMAEDDQELLDRAVEQASYEEAA